MTRLFSMWGSSTEEPRRRHDKVSKFLLETNDSFKHFLNNCSWFVYFLGTILICACVYYYCYDCQRRMELRRRRQEVQRANERTPQRRRPGAAYRDHEIFRNVMKTVRQYIGPNEGKPHVKPYVLRRTRSGAIYGRFADRDTVTS